MLVWLRSGTCGTTLSLSFRCHKRNSHAFQCELMPLPTHLLPLSFTLSPFRKLPASLSLSALWRKLVIMMRLIVAYFVVEVEVYTLRAQLVASLFPTLSLSVSDKAHSPGSPTNVCFLPLTPIGLNMQIHLRGHQSTK